MRLQRILIATSTAIAVLSAPAVVRAQVVTATGGEVNLGAEKGVVDGMIAGESFEVELGTLAAGKSTNPAVKELASMLVTDHRTHLEAMRGMAPAPQGGGAAPASDPSAAEDTKKLAQLRGLPADSTFDKAFVSVVVDSHQRSIDNLKKWQAAAKSPALKADVDAALKVAEQHLARAQAVAQAK
ncbi:MAG TPA: DUF4142 domain-containing protein [Gemmatimonadaceae bacterium]